MNTIAIECAETLNGVSVSLRVSVSPQGLRSLLADDRAGCEVDEFECLSQKLLAELKQQLPVVRDAAVRNLFATSHALLSERVEDSEEATRR